MFAIIPVGVNYSAKRYPVVTFTLMGICTAMYLVTLSLAVSYGHPVPYANTGMTINSVNNWVMEYLWMVPAKGLWWTYITSLFVHGGFFHLLGNMVYLFLFGSCVEDVIGRVRFVVFYLLCGIVASLSYIAMTPDHFQSVVPLGGASGAISGCIGGFLLLLLKTHIDFKWFFFLFFRPVSGDFSLPAWLVISAWFLKDLAMAILSASVESASGGNSRGGGVAFGAHVGGTLAGLGLIALEKLRINVQPAPKVRVAVAVAVEAPSVYLYMDGSQIGPFTVNQIRGMFSTGSISVGTVYWREGMEGWQPAEDLCDSTPSQT